MVMNVSPLDSKNQLKQNFLSNSNILHEADAAYEMTQNENDSHKSNSKRKIKRSFTTMADAAMTASLNSLDHQDKQLVSLKNSWCTLAGGSVSQVSKMNLNTDEE